MFETIIISSLSTLIIVLGAFYKLGISIGGLKQDISSISNRLERIERYNDSHK